MQKKLESLLKLAEDLKKNAATVLVDHVGILEPFLSSLEKPINLLKVKLGLIEESSFGFEKISTLGGKSISDVKPSVKGDDKQKALQNNVDAIIKEVDELLQNFLKIETAVLLDEKSDIVLRGVAKRAGLTVTEEVPEKITAAFVEEIKEALKAKESNFDL